MYNMLRKKSGSLKKLFILEFKPNSPVSTRDAGEGGRKEQALPCLLVGGAGGARVRSI